MDVREKLIDLILDAKRTEPETGRFTEYLADYLVSNGITVQDWVPVKDGLPERPPDRVDEQGRSWFTPNIDCIVYDGKSVFAANYCFQNKCFWCADTLHPLKNITHWMPMPHPPKGE